MSAELDYYEMLEISKTASGEEIKKSYRKIAMQCHPDKNPGCKKSEEKFKQISEAYDVLKDEQKRAAYDRYGHSAFKQNASGMGGGSPFDFDFGSGGFSDIFADIFSEFMGGGGSRQRGRSSARRGDDLQYNVKITLQEAFTGIEKEISVSKTKHCEKCGGHGTKDGKEAPTCSTCRGAGRVRVQRGFFVMEEACPHCKGKGKTIKEACSSCRGEGFVKEQEKIKVDIPAGIENGSRVRLTGSGNAGLNGGPSGDLYLFVEVKEHNLYEREGANLYAEVTISMMTATLGGKIEIPAINGEKIELNIVAGSQYGSQLKLKGKGMPHLRSNVRGDVIVQFKVEIPKKLNDRQKELLEEFRDISDDGHTNPDSKSFLDKIKDLFN